MDKYTLKIILLTFSIVGFMIAGVIEEWFMYYLVACLEIVALILCIKEHRQSE